VLKSERTEKKCHGKVVTVVENYCTEVVPSFQSEIIIGCSTAAVTTHEHFHTQQLADQSTTWSNYVTLTTWSNYVTLTFSHAP